jgi:hypothetical protein
VVEVGFAGPSPAGTSETAQNGNFAITAFYELRHNGVLRSSHSPVPIAHRRAGVEKLWLRTLIANKCLWPESIHHPAYLSIGVTSGTGPGLRGVSGGGDSGGIGVGLCTILDMNFREFVFCAVG